MRTTCLPEDGLRLVDREALHALGVLVPMQFRPVRVFPGRHPLGGAGNGMRMLRIRPYEPGEDNPRDIDKFSPPDDPQVVEWEHEARASVMLLADNSASMRLPAKWALRNACLLQLTYSFWRAGDGVGASLFAGELQTEIRSANLRMQMRRLSSVLANALPRGSTQLAAALENYLLRSGTKRAELVFVVSDFLATGAGEGEPAHDWLAMANASRRNIVPVVIGFRIPRGTGGLVKVRDPERNRSRLVRLSRQRVRSINEEEEARLTRLVGQFRRAGLDTMLVMEQREVYPALTQLARTRRMRSS